MTARRCSACVAGTSTAQRKRDAWQWARDAIGEVADYAAKSGVTLMLEPTATDSKTMEGCDDAIMMMEDIGRENVKLMFDVTHALYRNEVPSDYIYQMGKNLSTSTWQTMTAKRLAQPAVTLSTSCRRSRTSVMTATSQWKNGFPTRSCHPDVVARESLENLKAIEARLK